MFERFTESARRALFFARYEASEQGSATIGTEHMLLGLTRQPQGIVVPLLALSGKGLEALRDEVQAECLFRPKVSTSIELPFTAEAKQAIEFTAEEADRLMHRYIGTEHMLLGLMRVEGSLAEKVLVRHGMRPDAVRAELVLLQGRPRAGAPPRVDVLNHIERIKALVERLAVVASDPEAITELAHVIHVELSSLVAALSPPSESQ